ncbi:MAG: Glu/Leu/Phe/Val dehydrogenase [Promethearchaeota archaeon]
MVFKREPQMICEFVDANGLHAYVVIDCTRYGQSIGGLRISEDLTLEEVKTLARAMTLKYSFIKRNMGGAKCGIILPKRCSLEQRTQILEAFGERASPILKNKIYTPWTDMNSSVKDIANVMKAAGRAFHGMSDSSYFTALTVASAVRAACEIQGINSSTASVVIEGFGNVGSHVAQELSKWGTKTVSVSTIEGAIYDKGGLDIEKLVDLRRKYGDKLVHYYGADFIEPKELLLEMEVDALIPCARTWTINTKNMNRIRAKMIVPGANVPLTEEAEEFLHQKGILPLPDFVCNIGGVFGTGLYDRGVQASRVHELIMKEFGLLVKELIFRCVKDNCMPSKVAQKIAEDNFKFLNRSMQKGERIKRYLDFLLYAGSRTHIIPSRVVGWIYYGKARRILTENITYLKGGPRNESRNTR